MRFLQFLAFPLYSYPHHYGHYTRSPNSEFDNTWGHWIILAVILTFGGVVAYMIWREVAVGAKGLKVRRFVNDFKRKDNFWDEKKMKAAAENIFSYVQMAWIKQDLYYVTNMITDSLKEEWKKKWEDMNANEHRFHCAKIEIEAVGIVGAEDYADNSKDNFTVEVSAYVIRYIYQVHTRQPIDGHYNGKVLISDKYRFVRTHNKWMLNEMVFEAKMMDLLDSESKEETAGKPKIV